MAIPRQKSCKSWVFAGMARFAAPTATWMPNGLVLLVRLLPVPPRLFRDYDPRQRARGPNVDRRAEINRLIQ